MYWLAKEFDMFINGLVLFRMVGLPDGRLTAGRQGPNGMGKAAKIEMEQIWEL